jgi:ribose transport system substrate-binding protein
MKARRPLALVAGAALAAGALAATASSTGLGFTPRPKSGIKGALLPSQLHLWKYDKSKGHYVVVAGNASEPYVPHMRKAPKQWTIAFAEGWAANPFSVPIHKGVYKLAKQAGLKIIYCDNAFKTDQAITCAEQLAPRKPDFAIESNWQGGVAPAVSRVWDKAHIPMVNVDVWHPDGIFFGANNYTSGTVAGRAAGTFAKKQWGCKDLWIFLGEHKEEGAAADLRLSGFADGVQEICGALPSKQISREIMAAGTADQAITVTTDWLTGHPQATHILSTSIDDERATGIAKALVASRRDGYAVGQGCDTVGINAVKSAATAKNHYLGCVAFFPDKYPDYLVPIALDVLEGKPVPQEIHIAHRFLTHSTIRKYYP